MRWNILLPLFLYCTPLEPDKANLTAGAFVVQGQHVDLPEEEAVQIQELPEEPLVQGGILLQSPETHLEPRPSPENLDSLPYDDSPVDGNCTTTLELY